MPPRRSFLPAHTCCCCGGEGVSISGLLEAVATASGTNPGAAEKKKQKQHQLLLVQELLRKWATKGNVLEREGGMDCERERERERGAMAERREGGRERTLVQCSAVGGCHYERHLPHKGNRQGCR
jgi:hypothetical protein